MTESNTRKMGISDKDAGIYLSGSVKLIVGREGEGE